MLFAWLVICREMFIYETANLVKGLIHGYEIWLRGKLVAIK